MGGGFGTRVLCIRIQPLRRKTWAINKEEMMALLGALGPFYQGREGLPTDSDRPHS